MRYEARQLGLQDKAQHTDQLTPDSDEINRSPEAAVLLEASSVEDSLLVLGVPVFVQFLQVRQSAWYGRRIASDAFVRT